LSRDTYVNVMDQYYPAHKAETEPRFAEINRGISADELCGTLELARSAGLWRFDTRWSRRRGMIPRGCSSLAAANEKTGEYSLKQIQLRLL
jgi:hypothetical protein